ncbi:hypothetical protein MMPV_008913 [Pyropia vietnamensis]
MAAAPKVHGVVAVAAVTAAAVAAAAVAAATTTAAVLVPLPGGVASAAAAAAAVPTAPTAPWLYHPPIWAADVVAALSRGARLGAPAAYQNRATAAAAAIAPGMLPPPTARYGVADDPATSAAPVDESPPLLKRARDVTPHLAKLLRVDATVPGNRTFTFVCAGLLITERHVVTTARCPYTEGEMTLLAGGAGVHLTDGLAFRVTRRVVITAATAEEGSDIGSLGETYVAVWTFDAPVAATAPVLARAGMVRGRLAQAASTPRDGLLGIVGGWGVVDPGHRGGGGKRGAVPSERPDNLTLSVQTVVPAVQCPKAVRLVGGVTPADVFCAAGTQLETCVGDEGAPLAAFDDDTPGGEPYFVGLFHAVAATTSLAAPRCGPQSAAVYIRLSAHVAALSDAVAPYRLSFYG